MDIDIAALRLLEKDKEIPLDLLINTIEQALSAAYQKTDGAHSRARIEIDRITGKVVVWAAELSDSGEVLREFDDTPSGFGRLAATTARQIVMQKLRSVQDDQVLGQYLAKDGELVTGVIQQGPHPNMIHINIGDIEAVLPPQEQVPTEEYRHGDRIRAYVIDVRKGNKGPSVTVSRTHPNLIRKLFEREVPEIADNTVEIVNVAREAGYRTKIAVKTNKPGINAKGACIGEMGVRVRAVMGELNEEKIDIVDYSDDPTEYVSHALSPAKVLATEMVDQHTRSVRATVPEYQLSLAIGREGQNVRLAARLTGWRIDIQSDAAPNLSGGQSTERSNGLAPHSDQGGSTSSVANTDTL